MKSESTQKASINIAGKTFPLNLNAKEMARLQSIETEINNKLDQYQKQFSHMSEKESLSMVLISYAFELQESRESGNPQLLDQTLSQLESILDSDI